MKYYHFGQPRNYRRQLTAPEPSDSVSLKPELRCGSFVAVAVAGVGGIAAGVAAASMGGGSAPAQPNYGETTAQTLQDQINLAPAHQSGLA